MSDLPVFYRMFDSFEIWLYLIFNFKQVLYSDETFILQKIILDWIKVMMSMVISHSTFLCVAVVQWSLLLTVDPEVSGSSLKWVPIFYEAWSTAQFKLTKPSFFRGSTIGTSPVEQILTIPNFYLYKFYLYYVFIPTILKHWNGGTSLISKHGFWGA